MRWTIAFLLAAMPYSGIAAQLAESNCYIHHFETPVRCASLSVPLDYADPKGDQIIVTAAIVPATTAQPAADPVFVFAGGPGQAATDLGRFLSSAFKPVRRDRDVVLFDVRGTGLSGALNCPFDFVQDVEAEEFFRRGAKACADRIGANAAFYTSVEIVEDVERFRAAKGYAAISLWGGSFGTRVAQHYVRRYGDRVRAVILDAAPPLGTSLFATAPAYGQQALDRMFDDCSADRRCRTAFPALRSTFNTVLQRLEVEPLLLELNDPRTASPTRGRIDRDFVASTVRGALYAPFTRAVAPYAINRAARGDWAPMLALATAATEWSADTMAAGAMFSILCSEDIEQALKLPPSMLSFGFMRDSYVRPFAAACSVWPHRVLREDQYAPFSSKVPAMVISGPSDPVTPPASGEVTRKMFGRSVHVVVPHGLHTNGSNACVAALIRSFLQDPRTGGREHSCLSKGARPWFLTTPTL